MDIIKWRPFQDFDRFFEGDDLFPLIPAVSRKSKPSMNVYRTNDSVVAEVALEGMDPKNVEASIENDVLTVKGEEKSEKETKEKNYYFREIRSGSFSRSIALPAHVKAGEGPRLWGGRPPPWRSAKCDCTAPASLGRPALRELRPAPGSVRLHQLPHKRRGGTLAPGVHTPLL